MRMIRTGWRPRPLARATRVLRPAVSTRRFRGTSLATALPALSRRVGAARPMSTQSATAAAGASDSASPGIATLLSHQSLPDYPSVTPKDVGPVMDQLLSELEAELERLETSAEPTWNGLIRPLARIHDRLAYSWGVIGHLKMVKDSPALREAVQAVEPRKIQFGLKLAQSQALYEALLQLKASEPEWQSLDSAQQRIVEQEIIHAQLRGVGLKGEARERYNAIQEELASLSRSFGEHVLDATQQFSLDLSSPEDVRGLPPSVLEQAEQAAKAAGDACTGKWRFTLDGPSFQGFMCFAEHRGHRETLYRAMITRASQGDTDNSGLIRSILQLRQEMAALLGYPNYGELSLATKLVNSVPEALRFLEELRSKAHDFAVREHEELTEFAQANGHDGALLHWDVAYWAEKMKAAKFDFDEESLKPYFPLPAVLKGLFGLAERLFGVTVTETVPAPAAWHASVQHYTVSMLSEESGKAEPVASFFFDPYVRTGEKRGGAWMDECLGRNVGADGQVETLPVAYLVCNQAPPVGDAPALMTFRDVETLFHEFGHCAQHMLTRVDHSMAAGIRGVEWDAVELPSQFMENFCYDKRTLDSMTEHVETGAKLPDELYQKLVAAKTYRAGSDLLRQIHFAKTDMLLHSEYDPSEGNPETPFDLEARVSLKTSVLPYLPENRFLCSFNHIFAGGYSAAYYSYKWAEVMSADAFEAFRELPDGDEAAVRATGRRFRDTVLAMGGGAPAGDVFREFRGRDPTIEPLLKHAGLHAQ